MCTHPDLSIPVCMFIDVHATMMPSWYVQLQDHPEMQFTVRDEGSKLLRAGCALACIYMNDKGARISECQLPLRILMKNSECQHPFPTLISDSDWQRPLPILI